MRTDFMLFRLKEVPVCLFCVMCVIIILFIYHEPPVSKMYQPPPAKELEKYHIYPYMTDKYGQNITRDDKIILWYARTGYFPGKEDLTICPYSNCILTDDRALLSNSTAVLFGYRKMYKVPKKKDGQIWVIVNIESPVNDRPVSHVWNNKLDWSMTYRRDSEILLNYVTFNRTTPLQKNYHEIFKNKTKSVAWTVSNCFARSQRDKYVTELKKYIDVDIFGKCGLRKCQGSSAACHETLSQNYKFYLAFENSLCKDYATEKLFHTFRDNSNAIYVARGAPNLKEFVPPNTYIDTNKFKSPKALADYLQNLGSNETEYVSFLQEIDKYHTDGESNYRRALCDLCELLNTYKTRNLPWTGRNFNKWYRENACAQPTDIH